MRYARRGRARARDVAAGHTATDQVETVLYRLAASPGGAALLGMREREGRVVRPLLAHDARADARPTAARAAWRGARIPRTTSAGYARNRVRHGLVPALREIHPAAEANVLRTLEVLREEAAILDGCRRPLADAAGARAPAADLRRLASAPRRRRPVAHRVATRSRGARAAARSSLDLGGGLRAVTALRRDRASSAPQRRAASRSAAARAGVGPGAAGSSVERARDSRDGDARRRRRRAARGPRAGAPGDRMRPLGLGGSKSLQDLFTDRKVPRARARTGCPS